MEKSGCPPFWKKGFRSLKNFHEYARHAIDFVTTRFKPSKEGIYAPRKEHVPKDFKKRFATSLGFSKNRTKIDKIFKRNKPPENIQRGQKYGISEMRRELEKDEKKWVQTEETKAFKEELIQREAKARERGYQGDIKGNEVILPTWSRSQLPPDHPL